MIYLSLIINILILLCIVIFEQSRFMVLINDFSFGNGLLLSIAIPLINIYLIFKSEGKFYSYIFTALLILSNGNSIYLSYQKAILEKSNKISVLKSQSLEISNSLLNHKSASNNCRYPAQDDLEFESKKKYYISCMNKYNEEKSHSNQNREILSNQYNSITSDLSNLQKSNIDYWVPIKQFILSILISILIVSGSFYSVKELKSILSNKDLFESGPTEEINTQNESTPEPMDSKIVLEIKKLIEAGKSQRKIADELNLSQSKVARLIRVNKINGDSMVTQFESE